MDPTYRKGRSWKTVPDDKLSVRTSWARNIITEQFGSLAPFHDDIDLGSPATRPKLYERSPVVDKRISSEEIDEDKFINLIASGVEFLAEVYHCYRVGRHLDAGNAAQIEVESILSPRPKATKRKSFGLLRAEREAVHLRALAAALEWLEKEGYTVWESCSASPHDFEAEKNGEAIKVEVKGTTSDGFQSAVLTKDSVDFHHTHKGKSALITVSSIRLDTSVSTAGGWNLLPTEQVCRGSNRLWMTNQWQVTRLNIPCGSQMTTICSLLGSLSSRRLAAL